MNTTGGPADRDDELLASLHKALHEHDPAPDDLRGAAIRALTWDLGAAELASITYDTATDPTPTRSTVAGSRDLVFSWQEMSLELTLTPGADSLGVDGMLVVGSTDAVRVEVDILVPGSPPAPVTLDARHRFAISTSAQAASFEIRLRRDGADPQIVRTELLLLSVD